MDKGKSFAGRPILSQILSNIPKVACKYSSNRYYKRLPFRIHLVGLPYYVVGIFWTWSAVQHYIKANKENPVKLVYKDL